MAHHISEVHVQVHFPKAVFGEGEGLELLDAVRIHVVILVADFIYRVKATAIHEGEVGSAHAWDFDVLPEQPVFSRHEVLILVLYAHLITPLHPLEIIARAAVKLKGVLHLVHDLNLRVAHPDHRLRGACEPNESHCDSQPGHQSSQARALFPVVFGHKPSLL